MNKSSSFLIFFIVFIHTLSFATIYTTDSVPNPKVEYNGYISDPDILLDQGNKNEINWMLEVLENETTDQVALVVLNSIGDAVPKDFATELFHKWGIGQKDKDNGLLILIIKDQHRIEFETGYGLEGQLTDAECKRIQMEFMMPRFKEGNYDQGILDGIKATIDILNSNKSTTDSSIVENSTIPKNSEEREKQKTFTIVLTAFYLFYVFWNFVTKNSENTINDSEEEAKQEELAKKYLVLPKWKWITVYILIPSLLIGGLYFNYTGEHYMLTLIAVMYLYLIAINIEQRIRLNNYGAASISKDDYYDSRLVLIGIHEDIILKAIIFPIPFLFYYLYYKSKLNKLRNHPRSCKACTLPLTKLDENSDDKYLLPPQLLEEKLKSIDYDVWYCNSCSKYEALAYVNYNSKYSVCPKCDTMAQYLQSEITVISPTYSSKGLGERIYRCNYCKQYNRERFEISELNDSSSSYSSDSYSSSSSDSSSGSFGGGDSGGGGAGSSW